MTTRSIILSAPLLLLLAACAQAEEGETHLSNSGATENSSSLGENSLGTSSDGSGTTADPPDGTDTETDTGIVDTDTNGTDTSTETDTADTGIADTNGTGDTETTGMGFPDDAVFVHGEDGFDSNPGTLDEPKRTIQAAIDAAAELPGSAVYVAEGTYELDFQNNKYITLVDGVSLYGGYSADDWEIRNIIDTPSVLVDMSTEGGSLAEPKRALDGGTDVGPDTIVDGFTIQGGTGLFSAAVRVHQSAPTFTNNRILGGSADALTSYGVWIVDAAPTFSENEISAGTTAGPNKSYGIFMDGNGDAILDGNHVHGGSGGIDSAGIAASSSSPMIYNNVINGGSGSKIRGIALNTSMATIYNNTLVNDSTIDAVNIYVGPDSEPTIENNILTLAEGCIYEDTATAKSKSIRNNDLFCVNYVAHIGLSGMSHVDLAPMETDSIKAGGMASDNVKIEPSFVDIANNDAHLLGDGGTLCSLSQGALDQSMSFTLDRDRRERTAPWSIGAHELDGPCK